MTAIKAKSESRTILDFSGGKFSKNQIKKAIRNSEIIGMEEGEDDHTFTIFLNQIKVGMYTITLHLPFDRSPNWRKLREYGDFEVSIHDSRDPKASRVDLKKDPRFRGQYWVHKNFFGKLRIKHLIDIIAHCQRLDRLKAFL